MAVAETAFHKAVFFESTEEAPGWLAQMRELVGAILSTTCAARGNSKTASIRKVTPHRRNWRAGFAAQARMALLTKAFVIRKERLSLRFGQARSVHRFQDGNLRITSMVSGLTSSVMRRVVRFGDSYNLGGLPGQRRPRQALVKRLQRELQRGVPKRGAESLLTRLRPESSLNNGVAATSPPQSA